MESNLGLAKRRHQQVHLGVLQARELQGGKVSQNAIIYKWAVAELKNKNATLSFYAKLAAHYGTEVRDTQENIAKATGLHMSNVKHHLKVLEDLKIVEKQWIRERGGNADARKAFRFNPNPPK